MFSPRRIPRISPVLALVLGLFGCSLALPPEEPEPAPPDVAGADCSTACANLATLSPDACGIGSLSDCVELCRSTREAEASLDLSFPAGCMTVAKDCPAAQKCH